MGIFGEFKNEMGKFKPKHKTEPVSKSLKGELSNWKKRR